MNFFFGKSGIVMAGTALFVALVLSACRSAGPSSSAPPLHLPASYDLAEDAGRTRSADWWTAFDDDALNGLIHTAFSNNYSLKQAAARVEQSRALALQAGAALSPELSLNAEAARSKTISSGGAGGETAGRTQSRYQLSAAASYEVDLWGRVRASRRAAQLDAEAAADDRAAMRLSLAAQTADTWYALNAAVAQKRLILEQLDVSRKYAELTESQFRRGQASAVDVYQQRQQMEQVRSLLPGAEYREQIARNALAVLLGRPPEQAAFEPDGDLPPADPPPDAGVPADLLAARPDVRAAFSRLAAADQRLYTAAMDRLPALRLTGSLGYQAADLAELLDEWVWNLAANLAAPLVDGGRRRAEEMRRQALADEWRATVGQTLLTALREVEDALAGERAQMQTIAQYRTQIKLAEQTLQQTRSRYLRGLSEYLPVLTALSALQTLERNALDAERQWVSYRIQLHRALGDGLHYNEEQQP